MPILFHRHLSLGTFLYFLIIAALIGGFSVYGLFQARHLVAGPTITLTDEPSSLQGGATVTITGIVDNIVFLSLNGRAIYTDDSGNFEETLVLPPGYTIMTLSARDRYGRVHTLERTFMRESDAVTNHI